MLPRIQILFCLLTTVTCGLQAQNPVVFSVDRSFAAAQEVVTLHGSDFGTDRTNVSVFFGGVKGQIKSISNQIIEVYTPSGSTFDPIRVVNTVTGRSASAPEQFFLNYGGEGGITASKFAAQTDFQAQGGLYDLCMCDFDDDGKVDVATSSNNANMVTIFRNASSPGNINLVAQDLIINAPTLHVKCGDLNGDGRADIVLTEGADGSRLFILKNNGGLNFSVQAVTLTGSKVKQIHLSDLDRDGKQDIVVTNTGGSAVTILPNISSLSTISFGTPINISIPAARSTDALDVADLDDDGYPEIVTSQYQIDSGNKLYILGNGGAFNFSDIREIAVNKAVSGIRIVDLNADARPDIVITRLTGSDVSVYMNTGGNMAFGDPLFFGTETLPVGIDFSDFDGDGKLDIVAGSIAKSVSVLNNVTLSGNASFAPVVKVNTTYVNRNVKAADIDGDGKPDIVFTSVDDRTGIPVLASKVSILRNLSCMIPRISPGGPLNICTGTPLQLGATASGGTTYEWYKEGTGTALKSSAENFLDVTTSGSYHVVAVTASPSCSKESAAIEVTFSAPTVTIAAGDPDARSNGPVCLDNTLQLQVDNVGATEYRWLGPDGFAQSTISTTLERPSFSAAHAGRYIVEILAGTCVAKTDSVVVASINIPDFIIGYDGVGQFCNSEGKSLTVTPFLTSGFDYQWYEKSEGPITEASYGTFVAEHSGEYYVVITPDNSGCLPRETPKVALTEVEPPFASFEAAASGCVGEQISFTQQSAGAPGMDLVYAWAFGDGSTSGDANPSHVFANGDVFDVSLKVFYPGLAACQTTVVKAIEIYEAAMPSISASEVTMCAGDDVSLSVTGTFAQITWSTNETGNGIDITTPGSYSVITVDALGCSGHDEITITEKSVPAITITSDRQVIAAGQSAQLEASGADNYVWSPGRTLNDSTIAVPTASPISTTTYVVEGSLIDGCAATANITIQVSGELINVRVPVLFSPNGDEDNEWLVIEGVENYSNCSLNIFDKRGGRVFGTIGYQNNWNGTHNGAPLPEGVYYYVFGCPNAKAVTGTVTIIR